MASDWPMDLLIGRKGVLWEIDLEAFSLEKAKYFFPRVLGQKVEAFEKKQRKRISKIPLTPRKEFHPLNGIVIVHVPCFVIIILWRLFTSTAP